MQFRSVVPSLLIAIALGLGMLQPVRPASAAFPASTWSPGPYLPGTNSNPAAVRLADGRVLASGEYNFACAPCHKVSIYNPTTLAWTRIGGTPNSNTFSGTTATLLADGRVLIAGGGLEVVGSAVVSSTAIFDPTTETLTDAASMSTGRRDHTATLLSDGRVLVAGGRTGLAEALATLATTEIYDPALNTWSAADSLSQGLYDHGAVLVPGGDVVAIGEFPTVAERYDPALDAWSPVSAPGSPVWGERALLLANGRILAEGGGSLAGVYAERFDPAAGTWTTATPMVFPRILHTATLLADGRVLANGGNYYGFGNAVRSEIYDPVLNSWQMVDSEIFSQLYHASVALADGSVISLGGRQGGPGLPLSHTQTYGPDSDGDGYNDVYETLLGETVGVFCRTMRADVNFDNIVNSGDFGRVANQFFFVPVNRRHDQNGDNIVNSGDLGLMASRFNQLASNCL